MASAIIGSLRVNLGIDTAAFSDGLKQAQGSLAKAGKSLTAAGQTLTARLTGPLVAAAGAIGLGLGGMANDLSRLGNQANLANASVESFQKLAFASRTVGIEQEKLSDILKDVNDKVGDFLSTGGGEMAAFFENIAPKVGITAEAFRGLSGPDALQLYVSSLEKAGISQAEMTFYMEAIADEASALIPLLANNGAEYARLGDEAARFGLVSEGNVKSAQAFTEAMQKLGKATAALGLAFVESGVLDILTSVIERVTGWVSALNSANPKLTQFTLIAGALAAALGPALIALGLAATAIAAVGAPVALAVTAISGLTAAVVAFWPEIEKAGAAVAQFAVDLGEGLRQAAENTRVRLDEMFAYLGTLKDKFVQIGRDLIDGLWQGLTEKWAALKARVAEIANSIASVFRDETETQSPSQVFAAIGRDLMDGLSLGMTSMQGQVAGETRGFATDLSSEFTNILTGATNFRDALRGILSQAGGNLFQKGISGLGSALKIPGFATGTNFAPGGLAMVGERGPELVNLPRGSKVTPNNAFGRGGTTVHQTINVVGATGNSEVRQMVAVGVAQGNAQMRREITGISLNSKMRGLG